MLGNKKTVCDYVWVGTAYADDMLRAEREGKTTPFYNHNGNYKVDLSAIPLGVVIGAVGLFELFKK